MKVVYLIISVLVYEMLFKPNQFKYEPLNFIKQKINF